MSPDRAHAFWREVERRRNHLLVVYGGWFVAYPLLVWWLGGFLDTQAAVAVAFAAWGLVSAMTSQRLRNLHCYRCGEAAFAAAFVDLRKAKCQKCGVAYPQSVADDPLL